jgi:hypothetical protein
MNAEASTSQHTTPVPTHAQPQPATASSSPANHVFRTPAIPLQNDANRDPTVHPAFPPPPRPGSSFPRQASFNGGIGGMFTRPQSTQQSQQHQHQQHQQGGHGNGMNIGNGNGQPNGGPVMGTWGSSPQTSNGNDNAQMEDGMSGGDVNGQSGSGPSGISALSALMRNGNGRWVVCHRVGAFIQDRDGAPC